MNDHTTDATRPDAEKSAAELAEETKNAAASRASELKDKAAATARDAYETGKGEAKARADGAKNTAADETRRTADAVRDAADRFPEGDVRGQLASQLADGLGSVADQIRNKDIGDIPGDLTSFARKNPTMFFAGAAALGFAVARLAKASNRDDDEDYDADDYMAERESYPAPRVRGGAA